MSWLSELWKRIKGGKTDAELAFEIIVGRLSESQQHLLWEKLKAVQFALDMTISSDARLKVAREWVDGAIAILEAHK